MSNGVQLEFLMTPLTVDGETASGYYIKLYEAGTSTAVIGYADVELTDSLGSEITLESDGTKLVFVDGSVYIKVEIYDSNDVLKRTYDGLYYYSQLSSADQYLKRDGSLAMEGSLLMDSNDIEDAGDITIFNQHSLFVDHNSSFSPTITDMIVFGNASTYIQHYVTGSTYYIKKDGTTILSTDGNTILLNAPVTITGDMTLTGSISAASGDFDLGNNKITNVADGVLDTDGVNLGQVNTLIGVLEDSLGTAALADVGATSGNIPTLGTTVSTYNRYTSVNPNGTLNVITDASKILTTDANGAATTQNYGTAASANLGSSTGQVIVVGDLGGVYNRFLVSNSSNLDKFSLVDASTTRTAMGLGTMSTEASTSYLPLTAGATKPLTGILYGTSGIFSSTVQGNMIIATSAREKKKDISPFTESAVDILNDIDIVNFKYKHDTTETPQVGFIADDVVNFKDSLTTTKNDSMNLVSVCGLLIKAVQELSEKVKMLEG